MMRCEVHLNSNKLQLRMKEVPQRKSDVRARDWFFRPVYARHLCPWLMQPYWYRRLFAVRSRMSFLA